MSEYMNIVHKKVYIYPIYPYFKECITQMLNQASNICRKHKWRKLKRYS